MKKDNTSLTLDQFNTLVGKSTEIRGRLVLFDHARIDGKVVGNIESGDDKDITIVIGRTGSVSGDITAHRVIVAGKVDGNVYAIDKAEIHEHAEILGDVHYGAIEIRDGSKLLGLAIPRA